MPRMTGGDAIVDSLLRHGIDTIYGLPGVQLYGLFDSFARNANRLRVVNARHEQTTAYMAFGAAQSTGKPQACSVVPGPGLLNAATALSTAWGVNSPVICITGEVPSAMLGRERRQLHELPNQLATMKTLFKFAERIEHPAEAPEVMGRAFQAMMSGRPGPVVVEMPWDQFPATAEVTPQDPLPLRAVPVPDPDRIAALAKLIDAAKAPMIWVGGGAADAGPEVLALAERIGAPVASMRMGKGVVDARHPLAMTSQAAFALWDDTDLLIGIGTRLDVPLGRYAPSPAGLKVGRIDIDPAEHRRLIVDVPIVADAAAGTKALTAAVAAKAGTTWRARIAEAKAAGRARMQMAQPQMGLVEAIRDAVGEDGIIVDEVTQVAYIAWYGMEIYKPRSLISSGFSGTLGYGFPTALGVKDANRDKRVVSITGDGGFLYGGADLATAVQHGINLVTVLVNNSAYGNVLRDQKRLFDGRHSGSELINPDFQAFAKAFGVPSWQVTDAAGLRAALEEAFNANSPAVVEVMSDITKDYPPFEFHAPRTAKK
ncbi:MAG: thiamine pyrophosphate-binding protein [Alphaproteobacteria bacterium]|nr:thiamine pyrophosphate-binding protein [Alphaproteobacteria bacterium]